LLVAPGAYPRRKHLKGPPIGSALALPSNSKTQLERVTMGKPYSLLGFVISDEGKKFYNVFLLIVDKTSKKILQKLFKTWIVPKGKK
jgi:hypothetical protein